MERGRGVTTTVTEAMRVALARAEVVQKLQHWQILDQALREYIAKVLDGKIKPRADVLDDGPHASFAGEVPEAVLAQSRDLAGMNGMKPPDFIRAALREWLHGKGLRIRAQGTAGVPAVRAIRDAPSDEEEIPIREIEYRLPNFCPNCGHDLRRER